MKLPNIFETDVTPLALFAGDVVYSEGEQPTEMYIVQSGEVERRVNGICLETVGPDGFFGEMALADHGPRAATAVAKTECILIPVSEKHFLFMVQEMPLFALEIMRTMVTRARKL